MPAERCGRDFDLTRELTEAGPPGSRKPSTQTGFGALTYTVSPPTGLLGVGLGADSSVRMIALHARDYLRSPPRTHRGSKGRVYFPNANRHAVFPEQLPSQLPAPDSGET